MEEHLHLLQWEDVSVEGRPPLLLASHSTSEGFGGREVWDGLCGVKRVGNPYG